ncbi:MAG: copper-binding protein [Burkholderiaceae bacterium]
MLAAGLALAVAVAVAPAAPAQHAGHDAGKPAAAARPATAAAPAAALAAGSRVAGRATGVVARLLDAGQSLAMIAHDPVRSLNWPPMTMAFKFRDKALFGKLAPGAKIEFDFVQEGEDYVVTALQVR